jgi:hypothetical protein
MPPLQYRIARVPPGIQYQSSTSQPSPAKVSRAPLRIYIDNHPQLRRETAVRRFLRAHDTFAPSNFAVPVHPAISFHHVTVKQTKTLHPIRARQNRSRPDERRKDILRLQWHAFCSDFHQTESVFARIGVSSQPNWFQEVFRPYCARTVPPGVEASQSSFSNSRGALHSRFSTIRLRRTPGKSRCRPSTASGQQPSRHDRSPPPINRWIPIQRTRSSSNPHARRTRAG